MSDFNAKILINRLKEHLNLKTDDSLAKYLGLSIPTISSWKARNSFDFQLVYAKCKDIDWNYLFTGEATQTKFAKVSEPPAEYNAQNISNKDLLEIVEPYIRKIGKLEGQLELLKEQIKGERISLSDIVCESMKKLSEKEEESLRLKKSDIPAVGNPKSN